MTGAERAGSEEARFDEVRCLLMRGGTSKGAYFLAEDLPAEPAARDELLLRVMGSPDPRQIDGIGGGHPLTSKVAVVSPSDDPDADVDYLFLQVNVEEPVVSDRQNCGNILAGIGPFAVERGLVPPGEGRPRFASAWSTPVTGPRPRSPRRAAGSTTRVTRRSPAYRGPRPPWSSNSLRGRGRCCPPGTSVTRLRAPR